MIAVATEMGYKKIPGADHQHPAYHYRLTPGEAWKGTEDGWEVTPVNETTCKQAGYTFCLQWISGRTAALFEHAGVQYAQPIHPDPRKTKPKPMKEESNGASKSDRTSAVPVPPADVGEQARAARHERGGGGKERAVGAGRERDRARAEGEGARVQSRQLPPRVRVQPDLIKSSPKEEPEQAPARTEPRRVKGQRRLKKPLSLFD